AGLDVNARVLVIGAHPDDEDTQLIAWLARGRHVETAYLSLTRGDGGQNLIGNELGEALGVIRTEELLAARRVDGGRQYFGRAYDFGFSKSADEAFEHWPREELLRDVVTVVRAFRPHVIVSIFSGTPRDGHGQHQVAGILAKEAFEISGDTARVPVRAAGLHPPWTPLKLYESARFSPDSATISFNVGEYSPLRGRSYAELAGESRSQHKSQGFGALERKGMVLDHLRRIASRVSASDDPRGERSIFDGITPTIARVRPLIPLEERRAVLDTLMLAIENTRRVTRLEQPRTAVEPLERVLEVLSRLSRMIPVVSVLRPEDLEISSALSTVRARANAARLTALGLQLEATIPREVVALGDTVPVSITLYNGSGVAVPVGRVSVLGQAVSADTMEVASTISADSAGRWTITIRGDSLTGPWWLAAPRRGDMFGNIMRAMDETVERQAFAEVAVTMDGGEQLLRAPIVRRFADPVRGELNRPLEVAPVLSVTLDRTVEYAPANTALQRPLRVMLRSASVDTVAVRVSLGLPNGLRADSASRTVVIPALGVRWVTFTVRGRLRPGAHTVTATAQTTAGSFTSGYLPIEYEHIRPQKLYRQAATRIEAVDVQLPARAQVAYVQGVGDNVAPMLEQLGVPVTSLDPATLPVADLARYSVIVIGPRAYQARDELVEFNPRLLEYVRAGGTLVVQYGQQEMTRRGIMPHPITFARRPERVTVEEAPIRILDPDAPVLRAPNRITTRDFEGWVQERGLYMPTTFDEHYQPVLELNDPGEPANRGALLVTPLGRGAYVYTTLSFFRQLPAGVPGAARLFVNLLGAGGNGVAASAGQ
ncbi:MAG TPA: PIG-L family deacetylase, partial [Gemmatimonadaceae bacterium]|nr:PIG-L family deacetylase [Gemmatimonadaceae bacterium]